jgi:hypothetical protein
MSKNTITWDDLIATTKASPAATLHDANDQLIALREFNDLQGKPKKKRGNPEMKLVNDILAYLERRGDICAWRMNAGKVKTEHGTWFQGAPTGTSDIVGIHIGSGRFVAIEAKVDNNQPTEAQIDFIDRVNAAGGIAFPAWSVSQVEQRLEVLL